MTNKQKIFDLCSILDVVFSSFHPVHSIQHPEFLHPGDWREGILRREHFEQLKARYEKIKKE